MYTYSPNGHGSVPEQNPPPAAGQPAGNAGGEDPERAAPGLRPSNPDHMIALLNIYATQYGSYTTLLWQVPALSLTAQAFLLTIALTHGNGITAKAVAAALSAVISLASWLLMHDQRGHAINHGELAKTISGKLGLGTFLGKVRTDDGEPAETNAESLWTWRGLDETVIKGRPSVMYAVWRYCILLFLFVDIGIMCSVLMPLSTAVLTAAGLGVLALVTSLVMSRCSHRRAQERFELQRLQDEVAELTRRLDCGNG